MNGIRRMDIRAVDLNLLKAFDALMTERAVTRAADRIGLSQPAMSHALSRLRGVFADELFVRAAAGMEPTARAREIGPLVTAAIEHIVAALRLGAGFNPATSTTTFTAGMAEYAEIALVGPLARAFARKTTSSAFSPPYVNDSLTLGLPMPRIRIKCATSRAPRSAARVR
jgi:DNA-binding transcriptional LysR family regulator